MLTSMPVLFGHVYYNQQTQEPALLVEESISLS